MTILTVTNTGAAPTTRTFIVASPVATTPAALGTELTGSVTARYGLTTIKLGNAVWLGDVAQYATLPAGVVTGVNDFTVAAWVNPATNATWSRVFDFGTGLCKACS